MMATRQFLLLFFCLFQIGNSQAKNVDPLVGVVAQKGDRLNLYTTSSTVKEQQKIALLDLDKNFVCCLNVNLRLKEDVGADGPLMDFSGAVVNVYALELRGGLVKKFQEKRIFGVALRKGARLVESKQNTHILQYAEEKIALTVCT